MVEASPIKETALSMGLPVAIYDPTQPSVTLSEIRKLEPDFLVVVSFGYLLKRDFLSVAKIAPLNIHPSLLPRHRGASPMPWTLLEGDRETGVTVIRMNERMDAGEIVSQVRTPVHPTEDLLTLEDRLAGMGARLIVETLDAWEAGALKPKAQDEAQATYTKKFSKDDARLDFRQPADVLERRVRALKGWPGTFAVIKGKRLLVREAVVTGGAGKPGTILRAEGENLEVAAGTRALALKVVQLEGKKEMAAADFLRGFPLKAGERFE